jgi:hypothetical protein
MTNLQNMTDAEAIEAIEDDRRIFQALCTERDRLAGLSRGWLDSTDVKRTELLIERYAVRINSLPRTSSGCSCVVLPSGTVYPCRTHRVARAEIVKYAHSTEVRQSLCGCRPDWRKTEEDGTGTCTSCGTRYKTDGRTPIAEL